MLSIAIRLALAPACCLVFAGSLLAGPIETNAEKAAAPAWCKDSRLEKFFSDAARLKTPPCDDIDRQLIELRKRAFR